MHESQPRDDATLTDVIRGLNRSTDHLRHAFADARGVYQTDFRALLLIHGARRQRNAALTAGELATALELSSGAVTYLVERLSQAGYVQREVDPLDRRKVLLAPTAAGRKLVRDYQNPMEKVMERAGQQFGEQQVQEALDVLRALTSEMDRLTDDIRIADGRQPLGGQL